MDASPILICLLVCILIFIVLVAVIVAVVVVLITPHVKIEKYTAETRTDYGLGHVLYGKEVSLDDNEYYSEQFVDGFFYSRVFCDDDDEAATVCLRVADHDNCYKLTSYSTNYYTVPRAMSKEEKEVDCPTLHDPVLAGNTKRQLKKCDKYVYDASDYYREDWVESDTEYPVLLKAISYDKYGNVEYNFTREYTFFDGTKPTNKTGLKAPTGAKVFDFTDYGTGSSYLSRMYHKVSDKVKNMFSSKKLNTAAAANKYRFQREKLFRERTGLLPFPNIAYPSVSAPAPAGKKVRADIPESFDARQEWQSCSSVIGAITNQKSCGSCWAMSTAAVLSDRACINNVSSVSLSPQYMMSCYPHQLSCNGGYVSTVWNDVIDYGTVTETCYPFVANDTACPSKCKDGTPIGNNTIKVKSWTSPWAAKDDERVKAIQTEIMTNGPVAVSMLVFSDFYDYSKGVYSRNKYEYFTGGHMVRMIGWGVDSGEKYWLVANSWDTDWGLKGLFKIRRGTNECNIENAAVAGLF